MSVFIDSGSPSTAGSASLSSASVAVSSARASEIDYPSAESPTDTCQEITIAPMTSQGTSVASNGAELALNRKSRVTLNKVEKAKLFEWCIAHEVERTNGRARMRAVTEVVASARFL
jgi:hypothetical protein